MMLRDFKNIPNYSDKRTNITNQPEIYRAVAEIYDTPAQMKLRDGIQKKFLELIFLKIRTVTIFLYRAIDRLPQYFRP